MHALLHGAQPKRSSTRLVKQCSQRWRTREASRHRCECRLRCLQQQLGYARARACDRCAALALLATAQALSTTTLKPPTITATEKQVIACVDRVQRALDAAEDAPRASASIDPIDVADLATAQGRERLAEDLQKRHHAIIRVNDEGACQALQDAALSLTEDEARLQYIGGAAPVSQDRQTEFVGVFGGHHEPFCGSALRSW